MPLSHGEDESALVALGAPADCECYRFLAEWSLVRDDPSVLPRLVDQEGSLCRPGDGGARASSLNPYRLLLDDIDRGRRHNGALVYVANRGLFIGAMTQLGGGFRSAVARGLASRIADRWEAALARDASSLEHAARLVLRQQLPTLDQTKVTVTFSTEEQVGTVEVVADNAAFHLGRRWLPDVAADARVLEWWNAAWE